MSARLGLSLDEIIAAQKAEQKAAKAQQQQKQQQKAKAQQQKKDKASATARQPLKQQKNQHATNVTTAQHRPNKQSTAAQQKQSRVDQFSKNRPGLATHTTANTNPKDIRITFAANGKKGAGKNAMNASASSSATTHIVKPGTAAAKRVEATKKQQTPPKTNVPTGKPWKQRDSRQLIRQPYENESLNAEQSSSSQRNYIPTNRDNRYAERSPARAFQPRYDDREQAPYHSVPAYSSMPAPTPYTPVMPMAHAPVSAPLTMPYAPYGMAPMTAYAQPAQTGPMRAYNNANTVYTGYLDTQEDERYASPESYIRNAVRGRTHNRSERNVSDSEGRYQQHRQLAPEPAARTYTMSYSPPRAAPRALVQPWEI